MQGRLVPPAENRIQCFPRDRWADEFALAAQAELSCIEWIYDQYGEDVNPLGTETGIDKIKRLAGQHHVDVVSICADYFMDRPLLRASAEELEDRMQRLFWLLQRAVRLDAKRIVLPFVDASGIRDVEELQTVAALLRRALPAAETAGVELHLESALNPQQFATLLAAVPHPLVKVNYDSGNSSSLGYRPDEEFAAYGDRVGSVHIKDRVLGGGTLPLGRGDVDFPSLFQSLGNVGYAGDFILQVARAQTGDEVAWARQNRQWVVKQLLSVSE